MFYPFGEKNWKQMFKCSNSRKEQRVDILDMNVITPPKKSVPKGRRPEGATALRSNPSPFRLGKTFLKNFTAQNNLQAILLLMGIEIF